jgi:hypothetical protein
VKSVLIFSGSNQRAVIAFCRYALSRSIPFGIVANGADDTIFLTSYSNYVIATREYNNLTLDTLIEYSNQLKAITKTNEVVVLPSTEYLNRFLLSNTLALEKNGIESGLCEEAIYKKISDKKTFSDLCKSYSIKTPNEYKNLPSNPPFVCKPKEYASKKLKIEKPILCLTDFDLNNLRANIDTTEFYFQEFISGKSFYLLLYIYKEGRHAIFSQENLIQQHDGLSMIYCKSSDIHKKNEFWKPYIEMLIAEKFFGLIMVEVIEREQQYYMIEANPRLWGPSQLTIDANMSLFDDFAVENKLISNLNPFNEPYKTNVPYFWSGGVVESLQKQKQLKLYGFKDEDFLNIYDQLIKQEVYLREDTFQIFIKENNNG